MQPPGARRSRTVRTIRLHDTASGELRELVCREPGKVGIYACGPTVYNRIHIGNARPFVVFSLFKRFLQHEGYEVTFVANVTDVNDKIYDAARARGIGSEALAAEMTAHYVADTDGLGLGRPDHEPKAAETIPGMIDLITALIDRGAAYAVEGDVYFRVRADDRYGSVSHRHVDQMDQGEGIEGASLKEDPLDFALWKAQKEGEDTAWDSPWGPGRPAWHIECSVMGEELLGLGFEVHGGGNDLVFPHHENEAAQTRMGRGTELAQIWMHNGMLQLGKEKMAKSVGNIALLPEVLEEHGRDTVIAFFCGAHYRQPINFDDASLHQAAELCRRVREFARTRTDGPSTQMAVINKRAFFDALAEDFNTPRALAHLHGWMSAARDEPGGLDDLREMLGVLALDNLLHPDDAAPAEVVALAEQRLAARAAKDFAEADRLRDAIAEAGWVVRDAPGGFDLVPAP